MIVEVGKALNHTTTAGGLALALYPALYRRGAETNFGELKIVWQLGCQTSHSTNLSPIGHTYALASSAAMCLIKSTTLHE